MSQENSNNPFLAEITLPSTRKELVEAIACDPFRDKQWLSTHGDYEKLPEYFQKVVVPTDSAIAIWAELFSVMRRGYFLRDPSEVHAVRNFHAKDLLNAQYALRMDVTLILGETSLGKSYPIKAALTCIPQTIERGFIPGYRMERVTQVLYLYIEMTAASSMEALLDRIDEALDQALGPRDEKELGKTGKGRGSVEAYAGRVLRRLRTHFVGVLIIDEIQDNNLGLDRRDGKRLRNLLIQLSNAGIPVVMVGNPLALKFQQGGGKVSSQLMRRLRRKDSLRLQFASGPEDKDFRRMLQGVGRCTLLGRALDFDALRTIVYVTTGGISDFIVELSIECQKILAVKESQTALDPRTVLEAARNCSKISEFKPLIAGIVMRDPERLKTAYDDVDADFYEAKWVAERLAAEKDSKKAVKGSRAPRTPEQVAEALLRTHKSAIAREQAKNAQDESLVDELKRALLTGLAFTLGQAG